MKKVSAGGGMLSQVLEGLHAVQDISSARPRLLSAECQNALLRVYCAQQDLLVSTRAVLDAASSGILTKISVDTVMKCVADLGELTIRLKAFSAAFMSGVIPVPTFKYDPFCIVEIGGKGILVTVWHLLCAKDGSDWETHITRRIAKRPTLQIALMNGEWRSSPLQSVFLSALLSRRHGMGIPVVFLDAPKGDMDAAEKHYSALVECGQLLKGLLVEKFDCDKYL
jgi:hypothetical protein